MRALLFLCLAACSTTVARPDASVTVALPRAMIDELQVESARREAPVSTLLAEAWAYHGASLRWELSQGERAAPDFSRADRQPLGCWFDPVVMGDLLRATAQTGVDQGALLALAWRAHLPKPANVLASR